MNDSPDQHRCSPAKDAGQPVPVKSGTRKWLRRSLLGLSLMLAVMVVSGCQTLSFYRQAIKGQYQIIAHEEKIERLLKDPQTPPRLREKLALVQGMRGFAKASLKLPVDGHYQKYADVHRNYVV